MTTSGDIEEFITMVNIMIPGILIQINEGRAPYTNEAMTLIDNLPDYEDRFNNTLDLMREMYMDDTIVDEFQLNLINDLFSDWQLSIEANDILNQIKNGPQAGLTKSVLIAAFNDFQEFVKHFQDLFTKTHNSSGGRRRRKRRKTRSRKTRRKSRH